METTPDDLIGTLEYRAKTSGPRWEAVVVTLDRPPVRKVELSTDEDAIIFRVHVAGVGSVEAARTSADPLVVEQADRLAFLHACSVGEPVFTSGSIVQPPRVNTDGMRTYNTSVYVTVGTDALFTSSATVGPMNLGPGSRNRLLTALEQNALPGNAYFRLFRQVLAADEPIDKFMGLYRIVEKLYGPTQADVDSTIRRLEPGVSNTPRPDKPAVDETTYTRLRNQISHTRHGTSPETIRAETQQHLNGLTELVKKALAEQT